MYTALAVEVGAFDALPLGALAADMMGEVKSLWDQRRTRSGTFPTPSMTGSRKVPPLRFRLSATMIFDEEDSDPGRMTMLAVIVTHAQNGKGLMSNFSPFLVSK